MAFKMKYEIKADYLTKGSRKRPGANIKIGFGVLHDTGNPNSTAQGNVNYYKRVQNENPASAHIFVDDKEIIECVPLLTATPERAHHVIYNVTTDNQMFGDDANDIAGGFELCWGSKINNEEAYKRFIWVVAYFCHKFKLDPRKDLVGHEILDPRRKIDPSNGLKSFGKTYQMLLNDIVEEYNECTSAKSKVEPRPVADLKADKYEIKAGDTLWRIANQHGTTPDKLVDFNPGIDPKALSIGQVINLTQPQLTHTIVSGDTLYELAEKFDTSVIEIEKLNPGINPTALKIGDKIVIKGVAKEPVKAEPIKQPEVKGIVNQTPQAEAKALRPYPGKPVRKGMRGKDVEAVQRATGLKGAQVDGVFGENTERMVKAYQKRHGLIQDGIVGFNTWHKMF